MKRLSLKDHVKGLSIFQFYRDGVLYYKTNTDFIFRIPVADLDTAGVMSVEKSITLMKYIRTEFEDLYAEQNS